MLLTIIVAVFCLTTLTANMFNTIVSNSTISIIVIIVVSRAITIRYVYMCIDGFCKLGALVILK